MSNTLFATEEVTETPVKVAKKKEVPPVKETTPPVVMMEGTAKIFADKWEMDLPAASAFVKWLAKKGIAKKIGERKSNPNARGRMASVYQIPSEFTVKMI